MHSSMLNRLIATTVVAIVTMSTSLLANAQDPSRFDIGAVITDSDLAPWNIDVGVDGSGLPEGQGSVREGEAIYEAKCAACHGQNGQGQPMDRLAGGQGTLTSSAPVKTIGSYWPYATTLFDYVRRAMPLDRPQSLSSNEIYALTAYLLHLNNIVGANAVMDARTLPKARMPNADAFRPDPRPDTSNTACERACSQ